MVGNLLEKLGFDKTDSKGNLVYSFSDVSDENVRKELTLIQNVQLYKDFLSEEQLLAKYRGQLSNLVNSSKAKLLLGYDIAYQQAVSALKASIRNYSLSTYKNNKPVTYFTTNINFELKKLYQAETLQKGVRMSSDLNIHKNTIEITKSILTPQLGREPNDAEILSFIKKDLKLGSGLDQKKINRINSYSTKELSGSATIGNENASGAEAISFEDVMNSTENIDDILINDDREAKISKNIDKFTLHLNERSFLKHLFGIGNFKMSHIKGNIPKLRSLYGLDSYKATKLLNGFRSYCRENGVI